MTVPFRERELMADACRLAQRLEARRGALPRFGLHLNQYRDLDDYVRKNSDTRATGAPVTHRRCGAPFRIVFADT